MVRYQQKPLSFTVAPTTVDFDKNVTVSWAIPKDEATHKDWIGVCVCVEGIGCGCRVCVCACFRHVCELYMHKC